MNPNQNQSHSVRRIVLPSGRSIEVVRFDDEDPAGARDPPAYLPGLRV